jgi:hypothetical protein
LCESLAPQDLLRYKSSPTFEKVVKRPPPHPKEITPGFVELGTEKIGNFFCSQLNKSCEKRPLLLLKNQE